MKAVSLTIQKFLRTNKQTDGQTDGQNTQRCGKSGGQKPTMIKSHWTKAHWTKAHGTKAYSFDAGAKRNLLSEL